MCRGAPCIRCKQLIPQFASPSQEFSAEVLSGGLPLRLSDIRLVIGPERSGKVICIVGVVDEYDIRRRTIANHSRGHVAAHFDDVVVYMNIGQCLREHRRLTSDRVHHANSISALCHDGVAVNFDGLRVVQCNCRAPPARFAQPLFGSIVVGKVVVADYCIP